MPEWSAMLTMSIFLLLNIFTLLALINLCVEHNFRLPFDSLPKQIIIFVAYLIVLYFVFIHKEKYIEIEKQFKEETMEEKKRGTIYTLLYIVLTFGLFFLIMYLLILRNRGTF
jgi:Ca2+/Na+ antiporter